MSLPNRSLGSRRSRLRKRAISVESATTELTRLPGLEVADISLRTFADGNTYCRYEESIRGADLFIVQTSSPPVDQHLMELLIMIDAAKLASAKRITAVVPLYPYSR